MAPLDYTALTQDEPEDRTTALLDPLRGPRPEAYYGEGPFDPPSSDDEGDDLLGKQEAKDVERAEDHTATVGQRSYTYALRVLLILLASLVALSLVLGIYIGVSYGGTGSRHSRHQGPILMDHVFNGTFAIDREHLEWVPEGTSKVITSNCGI